MKHISESNLLVWRSVIRSLLMASLVAAAMSMSTDGTHSLAAPTTASDRSDVILWHTLDQRQALFLERLVREFNGDPASSKASIKLETGMELVQALIESLEDGTPPDAVLAPADAIGLARQFQLSEVPPELAGVRFGERISRTVSTEGCYYGVPVIDGNHLLLLYNRRIVDKPPTSLDELEKIVAAGGASPITWLFDDAYVFATFLTTFGWRLDQGRPSAFAGNEAVVQALEQYRRLVRALVPPDCGYDCVTSRFYDGKVATVINGEWALRDAEDRLGSDLGVAALPTVAGQPLVALSTTHALFFPGKALTGPKSETLRRFAKFLQSPAVQRRWHDEAKRIPVDPDVLHAVRTEADSRTKLVLSELERAHRVPTSNAMAHAWPAMHKGLRLFLSNVQDAATASAYMQRLTDTVKTEKGGL